MSSAALPETAAVYWRPRIDERALARRARTWTFTTVAHTVPFCVAALVLFLLEPLSAPVGLIMLAHAWAIPELYAKRGANVLRPRPRREAGPEQTALGLLGDLVGHEARELHARTGLVLERGSLGVWVVGEAGAVLVRPGGRRVFCWCVHVDDPSLPSADRIAHLLLALRTDEAGFATVANLAFSDRRSTPPAPPRASDALYRRSNVTAEVSYTGPCRIALQTPTILVMQHTSAAPQIRRLVLVPAPATASGRGDELVRRYRLARLRLAGREAAASAARPLPPARV